MLYIYILYIIWYIYILKYYSVMGKKETLTFVTTEMDLEVIYAK